MKYITAETANMAQLYAGLNSLHWHQITARTLSAAKAVAQRNRKFQRTLAHVAFVSDKGIQLLSSRINGVWVDTQ